MGCGFSSASSGPLRPCAGVRVIHTNGYVEDFHGPGVVTVAHVIGCRAGDGKEDSRYVLCSSAHLLQPGRGPFRPDDPLQPGTVYFLLPHSVFQSEASAVDLACLMNRLTALARKGCAASAPSLNPIETLLGAAPPPQQATDHRQPPPAAAAPEAKEPATPGRPAPWRPRLDRIDESIGRASSRSSACSEA